jgi:hypothetical protein
MELIKEQRGTPSSELGTNKAGRQAHPELGASSQAPGYSDRCRPIGDMAESVLRAPKRPIPSDAQTRR